MQLDTDKLPHLRVKQNMKSAIFIQHSQMSITRGGTRYAGFIETIVLCQRKMSLNVLKYQ